MSDQPMERQPATPMAQQILARGSLLDDLKNAPGGLKAAGAVFGLGFLALECSDRIHRRRRSTPTGTGTTCGTSATR